MKLTFSVFILLVVFSGQCLATIFHGILLQNESRGPAVANARITADGTQTVISGVDGRFDLNFPEKPPETQISLVLTKEGLVVVHSIMLHPILKAETNASPTIILMCKPAEREEIAGRYFRWRAEEVIDNRFEEKTKELAHEANVPLAYARLQEKTQHASAIAHEAAEELARNEPSNPPEAFQQAMTLLFNQKPDRALEILGNSNLESQSPSAKIGSLDLARDYKLKGELLALNFQFEEAVGAYSRAALLVTNDVTANFQLGLLYQAVDNGKKAEDSYSHCLKLARDSGDHLAVAKALNKLGEIHLRPTQMDQAHGEFEEALQVSRQLASKDPQKYSSTAAVALENLGRFYDYKFQWTNAFNAHAEALKIYRDLATNDPDEYLPHVAANLNALANYYADENRWLEASRMFEEALKFRRQLAKSFRKYFPDVAMTLKNLGYMYYEQNRRNDSRKAYEESLQIYKALAKDTPDVFGPSVKSVQDDINSFAK